MTRRGRPKVSSKTYAREKTLADKYPDLPTKPAHLRQDGPRNDSEQAEWDAWIAAAAFAIRTKCEHRRPVPDVPYEVPVIRMSEVVASETRKIYRQ